MSEDSAPASRLVFRQLLAGRDFATNQPFAEQMANFVYIIGDRVEGEAVLVDPAYAPLELLEMVRAESLELTGVVLTHFHADHAGGQIGGYPIPGIAELLEEVDVPVHVQAAEVPWVLRSAGVEEADLYAHEPSDVISVGAIRMATLHTPGHTPGSQCLLLGQRIVTGDTLFLNSCGRTDLPGGDEETLYDTLAHRLAPLPAETVVYCGHNYASVPFATMGQLMASNPIMLSLPHRHGGTAERA